MLPIFRSGILYCIFSCLGFLSYAETTYSFAGKIDKFPIYLSVSFDGNSISGSYFYKNQLVNIDLTGKMKDKILYLSNDFDMNDEENTIEVFKLNWNTKNSNGTWTKNKKVLKVTLSPIPDSELNPTKLKNNPFLNATAYNPLTRVKIGLFKLAKIDTMLQIDGRNLSYFKETHSNIQLFRVDNGYSATELNSINQFLESKHIDHFLGYLDCKSYSRYEVYYDFNYDQIRFNKEWFCFATIGSYYCGGAHPDEYMESVNFHIPSKRNYKLDELIHDIEISDETYGNSMFNKIVVQYFKKNNPEYFSEDEKSDDESEENIDNACEYYRPELYTLSISAVATKDGFMLFPYFEHYRGFCNWPSWCVIPYSELNTLIPEKFKTITHK